MPCSRPPPLIAALLGAIAIGGAGAHQSAPVRCGVEMRHVRLHLADDIVLDVAALDGEFISQAAGMPPVFDDPKSYTLRLRTADLAMDAASLTALIARALGSGSAPIRDDLLIDTTAILPPPRTEGRLQRVSIAGQRLAMRMTGAASPPARPATLPLPRARNYLYFFGGSIRFGKLTMADADMQLIDADPRDPFDFFPARYERQLIAGYSRNTPRHGLQVFMPDSTRVAAGGGTLPPPR